MMRGRAVVATLSFLVVASCDDTMGPNINDIPGYAISAVRVFPSNATLYVPDTIRATDRVTFDAVALGKGGAVLSGVRFVWASSDESIAVVDSGGVVTPVRPGTVEITASAHKIGKATLVILPATASIEVTPVLDSIFVDEPIVGSRDVQQLTATATDAEGDPLTGVAFAWQSSAPSVATVDESGLVHATGLGTATITVTANGISAASSIRVVPLVARVDLTAPSQVLALDTLQLTAVARGYNDATMARQFTWTSSNPSVATVDSTGRVIFLSTGQASFTARTAHRTASVTVTALERRLIAIDAGAGFSCGFTALGRGYCWGLASDGRTAAAADSSCYPPAGQGTEGNAPCTLPPKRMNRPELSFTAISSGGNFACGITTDRLAYCWGSDSAGQIGNGNDGAGARPSLASVRNERFTMISAGLQHACALNLAGTAYCWGDDTDGQLGDHRSINSTTPIPVADTSLSFKAISAGDRHTCGITTVGQAYCWGDGDFGQLGNGQFTDSDTPTLVGGGLSWTAISAGRDHTCAVDTSGNAYCWGDNTRGQLGNGDQFTSEGSPVLVIGGGGYSAISAGGYHNCGISGGTVKCWGASDFGEVGDGDPSEHDVVVPASVGGLQAAAISVGDAHSCAIATDGRSWCWGSNRWGALGNEYQAAVRATPQLVARPR